MEINYLIILFFIGILCCFWELRELYYARSHDGVTDRMWPGDTTTMIDRGQVYLRRFQERKGPLGVFIAHPWC